LQDFGEHGREFISSEVGLRLLQVLADPRLMHNYTGPGKRMERLNAILQQTVLKVRLLRLNQAAGVCAGAGWAPAGGWLQQL
jgi:hypothetical protein